MQHKTYRKIIFWYGTVHRFLLISSLILTWGSQGQETSSPTAVSKLHSWPLESVHAKNGQKDKLYSSRVSQFFWLIQIFPIYFSIMHHSNTAMLFHIFHKIHELTFIEFLVFPSPPLSPPLFFFWNACVSFYIIPVFNVIVYFFLTRYGRL